MKKTYIEIADLIVVILLEFQLVPFRYGYTVYMPLSLE